MCIRDRLTERALPAGEVRRQVDGRRVQDRSLHHVEPALHGGQKEQWVDDTAVALVAGGQDAGILALARRDLAVARGRVEAADHAFSTNVSLPVVVVVGLVGIGRLGTIVTKREHRVVVGVERTTSCLLYTSDAAD